MVLPGAENTTRRGQQSPPEMARSCATRGRQHVVSNALFHNMQRKRRIWTRTIEKAKSNHWKEFLDKAGEGHLWKAVLYIKPRETYGCIPLLNDGTDEVVDNECKAKIFMDAFFPKMVGPETTEHPEPNEEIQWDPITKEEVL